MTHHHEHGDHSVSSSLTFEEKMIKRLEHWLHHNDDHAETYRQWAQLARDGGMPDVGASIESAADMTRSINEKLQAALTRLQSGG